MFPEIPMDRYRSQFSCPHRNKKSTKITNPFHWIWIYVVLPFPRLILLSLTSFPTFLLCPQEMHWLTNREAKNITFSFQGHLLNPLVFTETQICPENSISPWHLFIVTTHFPIPCSMKDQLRVCILLLLSHFLLPNYFFTTSGTKVVSLRLTVCRYATHCWYSLS